MASVNFGFAKVERLQGNVGYIDIRGFVPAEFGRELTVTVDDVHDLAFAT